MASRVPMSQFFHNEEGIDREVITTEVPRFLGRDATVRPAQMGVCTLPDSCYIR